MALPKIETFTNSDGTYLSDHNPSWSEEVYTGFRIESNSLHANRSGSRLEFAWWNADSFNVNQYAQAVVAAIGSSNYVGVVVRASAANAYSAFWSTDAGLVLRKTVAGVETGLGTATAPAVSDVIYLQANGTTITVKKNGATVIEVTDSSLSAGAAGVCEYGGTNVTRLDTLEVGNLGFGVTMGYVKRPILRPRIFAPGNAR